MRHHALSRIVLASLLIAAAESATAADLYGGGATFPAPAYVGDAYHYYSPRARLSRAASITAPVAPFALASLGNAPGGPSTGRTPTFAALATDAVSYCQTGSGNGKRVFNNDVLVATGPCGDATSPASGGFSALSPTPDFIGTDSPTSTADYATFNTNMHATRGAITQIPVLAGSIAVTYHHGSVPALLGLNTEKLCKIFGKVILDWNDPTLGLNGANGPIRIVYRADGSGTSFALSSYLSSVCSTWGIAIAPNQNFAAAVGGAGAGWIGAHGDSELVNTVKQTHGAIAYAGFAEVIAQSANYATVNSFSPHNMPPWLNLPPAQLRQAQVLDGATLNVIPPATPALTAMQQNCLKVMSPSVTVPNTYPILAFTYLNTYYSGHAAGQATALKNLLRLFYSIKTVEGVVSPAGPALPVGYSYLHGNAAFRTAVNYAINGCVN